MGTGGEKHQTLRHLTRRRDVNPRAPDAQGLVEGQSFFAGVILRDFTSQEFIQLLRSIGEGC